MIAHIVHREKFTSGYVNFMKTEMNQYTHVFIILSKGFALELSDLNGVIFIDSFHLASKSKDILELLSSADYIIATGIFDSIDMLWQLPSTLLNKLYLHLWGGDFYFLEEKRSFIRYHWQIKKQKYLFCFKKCAGLIFLINGEYEKFNELTSIKKRYFIAPMPTDPVQNFEIKEFRNKRRHDNYVNILVGNSATMTNRHEEVFRWLAAYKEKNINVHVPLSYGNEKYRNDVIERGKKILGKCFIPILDYMDGKKYTDFLAGIDIGIFNNNRQQAMGNIITLLGLGKKLYLRTDTSMWKQYMDKGYIIFPFDSSQDIPFKEFTQFTGEAGYMNMKNYDEQQNIEVAKCAWESVFSAGGGNSLTDK